jgi:hypothetical protein
MTQLVNKRGKLACSFDNVQIDIIRVDALLMSQSSQKAPMLHLTWREIFLAIQLVFVHPPTDIVVQVLR